ncbi:MAG: 50S ribosomal protein L9 [bacterium]
MKIILLKDVKDIGPVDTVKDVSDGYARNYLVPKGFALSANAGTLKSLEARLKVKAEELEKQKIVFKETASKIDGREINIQVDVGENGKLFGSVTHQDIAQKIHESFGIEVDKKKIVLDQPIKTIGSFEVPVRFAPDISSSLKVNVTASSK